MMNTKTKTTLLLCQMLLPLLAMLLLPSQSAQAGHWKNFKVSSYIRAQDVIRMGDKKFREETYEKVLSQVPLDKIYLETHRDSIIVPEKTMKEVIAFFKGKGLELGGGITYTISEPKDFETYSYARPRDREAVKHIAEYTASFFDDIILDDFFFIDIKNDDEIVAKGDRSWTEYRLKLMSDAGRELVMEPAHRVNPNVRVIIKYPNWYDHFQGLGFNLETEPFYFDGLWTGTETRDPASAQHLQNYLSYNIIRYFSNIAPGKNGGGWVDAGGIQMGVDRYAEQLHLTMVAKAPEIILWNYMQLNDVAIGPYARKEWQGSGNSFNYDEMMAPRKEGRKTITPSTLASVARYTLLKDDALLGKLGNPIGIASYKPYHSLGEDFLQNYLGMIGLPMDMFPSFLQDRKQVLLTEQALCDKDIISKIEAQLRKGGDVIVTTGFVKGAGHALDDVVELRCTDLKAIVDDFGRMGKATREFIIPQLKYYTNDAWEVISAGRPLTGGVSGYPILLRDKYSKGTLYVLTIPDDFGNLYDYPAPALGRIRERLTQDMDMYFEGPSKVGIFVYDNRTFMLENFNDFPVEVKPVFRDKEIKIMTDLESGESVKDDFSMTLPAHSYRAFSY